VVDRSLPNRPRVVYLHDLVCGGNTFGGWRRRRVGGRGKLSWQFLIGDLLTVQIGLQGGKKPTEEEGEGFNASSLFSP
jgi:hypothetical protein